MVQCSSVCTTNSATQLSGAEALIWHRQTLIPSILSHKPMSAAMAAGVHTAAQASVLRSGLCKCFDATSWSLMVQKSLSSQAASGAYPTQTMRETRQASRNFHINLLCRFRHSETSDEGRRSPPRSVSRSTPADSRTQGRRSWGKLQQEKAGGATGGCRGFHFNSAVPYFNIWTF